MISQENQGNVQDTETAPCLKIFPVHGIQITYLYVFINSGEGRLNDIWLLEGDASEADKTPSAGGCGSADFNLIALHGIFMFLGWGVLLQGGAFIARYFRHREPEGWWFKMHRIFQVSKTLRPNRDSESGFKWELE